LCTEKLRFSCVIWRARAQHLPHIAAMTSLRELDLGRDELQGNPGVLDIGVLCGLIRLRRLTYVAGQEVGFPRCPQRSLSCDWLHVPTSAWPPVCQASPTASASSTSPSGLPAPRPPYKTTGGGAAAVPQRSRRFWRAPT
jgi:hypothetical protein